MDGADAGALVAKLRAAGMDVWLGDGKVCSRWRAGGRAPYGVAVMLADLRDLGMVAVDFLQHEAPGDAAGFAPVVDVREIHAANPLLLPEPDADGIVRLVRVSPEVAFAAGDLINDGKGELIGKVIYRRISNVFDVTYRVVES